jgi:hypothetical protein
VPNTIDTNNSDFVANFVENAMVSYSDPPIIYTANQLATTGRARLICKALNSSDDSAMNLGRKPGEIPFRGTLKQNAVHHFLPRSAK